MDDTLAEGHHGLAALKWVYYRDWSGAEQAFRQAIQLNSNIGAIHSHFSIFLSVIGKFDEAIAEGQLALELDPLAIRLHRNQAARFYLARRYDDAVRQFGEALELEPGDASLHEELGDVYGQMGLHFEAIAEWLKATSLAGDKELAEILQQAKSGDDYADAVQAIAQTRLKRLNARIDRGEFVPAVFLARAYIRLGDIDQALRRLEEAGQERTAYSLLMNIDPFYHGLREDPRFVAILKSMNLG